MAQSGQLHVCRVAVICQLLIVSGTHCLRAHQNSDACVVMVVVSALRVRLGFGGPAVIREHVSVTVVASAVGLSSRGGSDASAVLGRDDARVLAGQSGVHCIRRAHDKIPLFSTTVRSSIAVRLEAASSLSSIGLQLRHRFLRQCFIRQRRSCGVVAKSCLALVIDQGSSPFRGKGPQRDQVKARPTARPNASPCQDHGRTVR